MKILTNLQMYTENVLITVKIKFYITPKVQINP